MQFTQEKMLTLLEKSGREGWTLRQMAALREEGLLPPLRRQTQPGTNKPLYVWDEEDIDQIVDVYDWWRYCNGDRATLTLALWLRRYKIPLDLLCRLYLRVIEGYLQRLTRGKTDLDDVLDEVSNIVVAWSRKYRYSPRLAAQRKQMSVERMELVTEMMLGALAIPDQELTAEAFRSFLLEVGESLDAATDGVEIFEEFFATPQRIAATLRDILTLPNLREAVQTATPEQWEQAREDYLTLCQLLSELVKAAASSEPPSFPEWFTTNLTLMWASLLIVPFLSARYRGYGQLLDMAFEKIHEMLTDPSFIAQALQLQNERARRTIEADVNNIPLVS